VSLCFSMKQLDGVSVSQMCINLIQFIWNSYSRKWKISQIFYKKFFVNLSNPKGEMMSCMSFNHKIEEQKMNNMLDDNNSKHF